MRMTLLSKGKNGKEVFVMLKEQFEEFKRMAHTHCDSHHLKL